MRFQGAAARHHIGYDAQVAFEEAMVGSPDVAVLEAAKDMVEEALGTIPENQWARVDVAVEPGNVLILVEAMDRVE